MQHNKVFNKNATINGAEVVHSNEAINVTFITSITQ